MPTTSFLVVGIALIICKCYAHYHGRALLLETHLILQLVGKNN